MKLEYVRPDDIERRSFEIIENEIAEKYGEKNLPEDIKSVVMRVIHTTADFDYLDGLVFSEGVIDTAIETLKNGAVIVTDTNMALAGINKPSLKKLGCEAVCFMSDDDVAAAAGLQNITRAAASVDKAAHIEGSVIYAVGNAPTALVRLCEHIERGIFRPAFVIGVPVGFVNVVQSKKMLMDSGVPYIVSKGRKGGSTVAAAICNALSRQAG